MKFSFLWPIDMTLSDANTPDQNAPGSDGNEGLLHISQSSSITGTSPSDCLMSYLGHSLVGGGILPLCREAVGAFYSPSQLGHMIFVVVGSYLSAEKQSVYSIAPADWAIILFNSTIYSSVFQNIYKQWGRIIFYLRFCNFSTPI